MYYRGISGIYQYPRLIFQDASDKTKNQEGRYNDAFVLNFGFVSDLLVSS